MIWFTWRQFRSQIWITVGILAALGTALLISGRDIADAYTAAGLDVCKGDCTTALNNFLHAARTGTNGTIYDLTQDAMYVVPALIGIFWGAPLIARELEAGTHRLAWNQSVTRTRWLASKLAVGGAAAAVTAAMLSWAVTTWAGDIDAAAENRIQPLTYGARGIVPVSYAVFAFALGTTAGMLIRRAVPAMAATLAGYIAAVASMPLWIRAQLVPARHGTPALNIAELQGITIGVDGRMSVLGKEPSGDWVLSNRVITADGQLFTGPADPQHCGRPGSGGHVPTPSPSQCQDWLGTLGLRQDIAYHPASHFWPLQWAEAGIFLAAAALLVGFCFWWIRRLA